MPKLIRSDDVMVTLPNPQPKNKWRRKMKGITSKSKLARLRMLSGKSFLNRHEKYAENLFERSRLFAEHARMSWLTTPKMNFSI